MKGSHRKYSPSIKAKVALEALKDEEASVARTRLPTDTTSPPKFLEVDANV